MRCLSSDFLQKGDSLFFTSESFLHLLNGILQNFEKLTLKQTWLPWLVIDWHIFNVCVFAEQI